MSLTSETISLTDEASTDRLASKFAAIMVPGDTVLLEGPIGAGKTYFARSLIRSYLGSAVEVPSPTFTLVQTYESPRGDIWHCDLYRLSVPQDSAELGLQDAFETAICLIEWPDRLGELAPPRSTLLTFKTHGEARKVTITGESRLISAWTTSLG